MNIHEYQAKRLFRDFGIVTPRGEIAESPTRARSIAARLKKPVMIKAQVHAGGRGKSGGIRRAVSPREAERAARELLGARLATPQSPPEGMLVQKVLIEETLDILREFYLAIIIDPVCALPIILARQEGGVDVEESVLETFRQEVDINLGIQGAQVKALGLNLGIEERLTSSFVAIVSKLYRFFIESDCLLAEINPLILTKNGMFIAADAKVVFDDNALFRHPELEALRDDSQKILSEAKAEKYGVNYVQCDGDITVVGNGAGLAMATRDALELAKCKAGGFLDLGGGADEKNIENAFRVIFSDPSVKGILFNIVAGVFRFDALTLSLIKVVEETGNYPPLVVRFEGLEVEKNIKALKDAGIDFVITRNMRDAVREAAKLKDLRGAR